MTRTQSAELIRCDPANSPRLMPDILYVTGTGRSGTTVLDVLLGNNAGVTGVGEFTHILRHGFLQDRQCSCGKGARACELWARVRGTIALDDEDCARAAKLIAKLERHSRFLPVWFGWVNRRELVRYRQVQQALFEGVSAATGSSVVVDSSKYETRALLLSRLFGDRVKVLCITRSAADLISAFRKRHDGEEQLNAKSTAAATAYYAFVLFCMRLLRYRLGDRCLVLRFEDLKRDPAAILSRIECWSGYRLTHSIQKLNAAEPFVVGHIVSGNRLRKRGTLKFEANPDEPAVAASTQVVARMLEAYRGWLGF